MIATTDASKEETLESLRQWGLLHILPLQTPESERVSNAKTAFKNAEMALEALPAKANTEVAPTVEDADLLPQLNALLQTKKNAEEACSSSSAELKRVEAFGDFDPATIKALHESGINIKLYTAEEKKFKPEEEIVIEVFKKSKGEIFFAAFGRQEIDLPYTEINLPQKSVAELKKEKEQAEAVIKECEKKLEIYAVKREKVKELVANTADDLAFGIADAGMHSEIGVAFIQGYCPKDKLASLSELVAKNGWGITAQDPKADEAVPTLLKHKKAFKPIDALYNVIGITPGYREIDVSSAFLCFFSIFFAMIVGDAGYGLLFMAITFFVSRKLKNAPRYPFHFLYLMSGCTIIWGVFNASYFGMNSYGSEVMAVPKFLDIVQLSFVPAFLKKVALWVRDSENVKYLCFIIALIHLSIARLWNIVANIENKANAVVQAGWFCTTWTMFFLACNMVLSKDFPQAALYVGILGAVLIVIGNVMKKEWFSVGMLPLNLVSNLVDVISYIRLFAVGMAGFSVANAFNVMVAPLFGTVVGSIGAALILLLAHALNIALAAMGVAVHAVRLNTLEFSNSVGVEWSGSAYTPFKKSI